MLPTRDHQAIRQWAARTGAVPAEVKPRKFDGEPSILYFLFGSAAKNGTPEIRPISWEDFFARFDLLDLSMVYDQTSSQFEIVRLEKSSANTLRN